MPTSGLPWFELSLLTVADVPLLSYLKLSFSLLMRFMCSLSYSHEATEIVDLLLLAPVNYVLIYLFATAFLLCLLAAIIFVLLSFMVISFLLICSGLLQAGY